MNNNAALPPTEEFVAALKKLREECPRDGYFSTYARFIMTYELIRRFCAEPNIVELGAWPGDFALALARIGVRVTAVDLCLNRPVRKVFNERSGQWQVTEGPTLSAKFASYGIAAYQCDLERDSLPFGDQSVGFVLLAEVIEHLNSFPLHTLREIRRILCNEGKLLITTPNLLTLRNRISFLWGEPHYDTLSLPYDALIARETVGHTGHFRLYTMAELIDLLERLGFLIEYKTYLNIPPNDVDRRETVRQTFKRLTLQLIFTMFPSLRNTLVVVARGGRSG